MKKMTSAWVSGDLASLEDIFQMTFSDTLNLKDKILFRRNRNWTPKIKTILDKPGNYAVVVGAAHLVGKESVIDLLKQEGLFVKRVH